MPGVTAQNVRKRDGEVIGGDYSDLGLPIPNYASLREPSAPHVVTGGQKIAAHNGTYALAESVDEGAHIAGYALAGAGVGSRNPILTRQDIGGRLTKSAG